jgi:toxin YoeB
MEIVFLPEAEQDLNCWIKTGNKTILKKITQLVESIAFNPYKGIGKPEPLKYSLTGCWSRRINQEHRIVYEVIENKLLIYSLRGHYNL